MHSCIRFFKDSLEGLSRGACYQAVAFTSTSKALTFATMCHVALMPNRWEELLTDKKERYYLEAQNNKKVLFRILKNHLTIHNQQTYIRSCRLKNNLHGLMMKRYMMFIGKPSLQGSLPNNSTHGPAGGNGPNSMGSSK